MVNKSCRAVILLSALVLLASACASSGPTKSASAVLTSNVRPAAAAKITPRVRDQPRERELREHVGSAVAGEVPQRHAARRRGSCSPSTSGSVTRASTTTSREISGQAPNPSTQADCPIFADFVSTGVGAVPTGAREGLRVPEVGADDRRPTPSRGQDVEGVHAGHRELADRFRKRAGTRRSAPPT